MHPSNDTGAAQPGSLRSLTDGRPAESRAAASDALAAPRHIPDRALRVRGNPDFPGHDARGLRNGPGAAPPDLVVLGGGHAYGSGVGAEQCWPRRLQGALGLPVLNAGMDGWGSVQCAIMAGELAPLAPRRMLACLYAGSELAESFQCARVSVSPLARSFWRREWLGLPLPDCSGRRLEARVEARIEAMLDANPELPREDALALLAQRGEPDVCAAAIDASRFYLSPRSILAAEDLLHPAIAAGLEITRQALAHLRNLAEDSGMAVGVALFPSREYLVSLRLEEASVGDREAVERAGMAEACVLAELRAACAELSLRCFDLSGYLKHFIGSRIYPQNSREDFLNARGCEVVARYVRERVLPGMAARESLRAAVGGAYPVI